MPDNFWSQAQDFVADFVSDHWLKLLALGATTIAAWLLKKYVDRRRWYRRQFMGRINFSLNMVEDGWLRIRTLLEKELKDVLLNNDLPQRIVLKSAWLTTPDDAFVPLPKEEAWLILNAFLNEIAEKFSAGTLAADMGVPVVKERYVFGLTSEADTDVRVRKLRVMIAKESLLRQIAAGNVPEPRYESKSHNVRWKTLNQMAARYARNDEARDHLMRAMELCVPVGVAPGSPLNAGSPPALAP